MSILKVDTINEKTTGNGVEIAHALKGSGIAGHVVQAVYDTNILMTSNNSTSYQDLLSVSFTPKFDNSMLFIISTIRYQENASSNDIKVRITHDGSNLIDISRYFNYSGGVSNLIQTSTIQAFVSSTGSTSARYIKVQAGQYTTGTSYFNTNGTTNNECSLFIQEIAQ